MNNYVVWNADCEVSESGLAEKIRKILQILHFHSRFYIGIVGGNRNTAAMAAVPSTELNTYGDFGEMVVKKIAFLAELTTFRRIARLLMLQF